MLSSVPGWKWHRDSASASASPTVLACLPPDKQLTRYVVDRATVWRRKHYQDDDRYRHSTEAAMLEQVCGVEGVLKDLGEGWW